MHDLVTLCLVNEPGQNIDTFSQKAAKIAKHLDDRVDDELKPKDLNLLVIGCF